MASALREQRQRDGGSHLEKAGAERAAGGAAALPGYERGEREIGVVPLPLGGCPSPRHPHPHAELERGAAGRGGEGRGARWTLLVTPETCRASLRALVEGGGRLP
jgi:hypothetical protein